MGTLLWHINNWPMLWESTVTAAALSSARDWYHFRCTVPTGCDLFHALIDNCWAFASYLKLVSYDSFSSAATNRKQKHVRKCEITRISMHLQHNNLFFLSLIFGIGIRNDMPFHTWITLYLMFWQQYEEVSKNIVFSVICLLHVFFSLMPFFPRPLFFHQPKKGTPCIQHRHMMQNQHV